MRHRLRTSGRFMGQSRGKSARKGSHLLPHDAARLQVMLSTERSELSGADCLRPQCLQAQESTK